MTTLFLSHATEDDAVVERLQQALGELGEAVWIDSRQLRGGQLLWSGVAEAIDQAAAYAVLVSPAALQSDWVGDELDYALSRQQALGAASFPVLPLTLDGTKLGAFKRWFAAEPAWIPITSAPGGIDAALHAILVALGRRLPRDLPPQPQPKAEPLEDLVLELTDLKWVEQDSKHRPSARARLVYQPADPAQREVKSEETWRLVPKMGPIEADDLRWYLEDYAVWPSRCDAERARRIESKLS